MSEAYVRAAVLAQRAWEVKQETGKHPTPEQGRQITAEVVQMIAAEKRKWQAEALREAADKYADSGREQTFGVTAVLTFLHSRANKIEQQEASDE